MKTDHIKLSTKKDHWALQTNLGHGGKDASLWLVALSLLQNISVLIELKKEWTL